MALAHMICRLAALKVKALLRKQLTMHGSLSTSTTSPAPREAASNPRAPLPANKSRQREPSIRGDSQLNSVSRTRLGVGLIACAGGKASTLRFHFPPMIRTRPLVVDRILCDPAMMVRLADVHQKGKNDRIAYLSNQSGHPQ